MEWKINSSKARIINNDSPCVVMHTLTNKEDLRNACSLPGGNFLTCPFYVLTLLFQNSLILKYTQYRYLFTNQSYPIEFSSTMEIFFYVLQYGSHWSHVLI